MKIEIAFGSAKCLPVMTRRWRHLRLAGHCSRGLFVAAAFLAVTPLGGEAATGGLAPEPTGSPATGSGAHANIRRAPGESASFDVAGTNGYTLHVESEKGLVTVIASRERPSVPTTSPSGRLLPASTGEVAESSYAVANASRDPRTIRADFGTLGSISVDFRPSGKRRVTTFDLEDKSERCTGAAKVVRRLGAFTGSISFQAENGYTAAELGSAPGTLGTSPFRNCTTLPSGASRRPPARPASDSLEAALALHGADGASSFLAFGDATGSRFYAVQAERLSDGLLVLRRAQATGSTGAFEFAPGASPGATVRPPAPFAGVAAYADDNQGPTIWNGGLSVEFPGIRMPLTGPAYDPPRLRFFSPDVAGVDR